MKKLATIIILFFCLSAHAQQGRFEPFKLLILKPATANTPERFSNYRDSIVEAQIKRYYRGIKTYEDMANCKACDFEKDDIERYKNLVVELKKMEPEVKKFKYFELISSYSGEIYNFYFNEYEPYSIITELPSQQTSIEHLEFLAGQKNVDYIVFFDNILTVVKNSEPVLSLSTSLYSKKENKIILSVETKGDTNSRGEMWTCNNPLECLLINAVRTSTNEVADVLRVLQKRK